MTGGGGSRSGRWSDEVTVLGPLQALRRHCLIPFYRFPAPPPRRELPAAARRRRRRRRKQAHDDDASAALKSIRAPHSNSATTHELHSENARLLPPAAFSLSPRTCPRLLGSRHPAGKRSAAALDCVYVGTWHRVIPCAGCGHCRWRTRWLRRCNQSSSARPQGLPLPPPAAPPRLHLNACRFRSRALKRGAAWAAPASTSAASPPRRSSTAATCALRKPRAARRRLRDLAPTAGTSRA